MIKHHAFKIAFIITTIFFTTIFLILITDYNTKNNNFRKSPSIFKIEKVDLEYFNLEIMGNKFKIEPITININKKYNPIIKSLIPKKLKLINNILYYGFETYNALVQHQKNLDYLENIRNE